WSSDVCSSDLQFTAFFTYGLADRIDVSVAVPIVSASITAISNATIQRIGTGTDTSIHFFPTDTGDKSQEQFTGASTARGLGDIVVRVKGTVIRSSRASLAFGLDVRTPTGDEYDFLGSGAPGVKPFLALSARAGRLSPHLNLGFQYNGKSVLAGNPSTGDKAKLQNEISYAAGFDVGVTRRLT